MKRQETIPSLLAELKVAWPLYEAALKEFSRAEEAEIADHRGVTKAKGAAAANAAATAERAMRVLEKRAFARRKRIIAAPALNLSELLTKMQMVEAETFEEEKALLPHAIADLERLVGEAPAAWTVGTHSAPLRRGFFLPGRREREAQHRPSPGSRPPTPQPFVDLCQWLTAIVVLNC